jgi:4-oxalomesaconate tautomerase
VGHDVARLPDGAPKALSIEHPTGEMTVIAHDDGRTEVLRTARKLLDGMVF